MELRIYRFRIRGGYIVIIGLGEGLGFLKQGNKFIYGVRFDKQTISLTKQAYDVWRLANLAVYERESLSKNLNLSSKEVKKHVKSLENLGLLIEWPMKNPNKAFLDMYTIIPKGKMLKYENDEGILYELFNDQNTSYDILPTTIWRLANPFMTLNKILENVVSTTNLKEEEVIELSLKWIPYLINQGFLSVEKW